MSGFGSEFAEVGGFYSCHEGLMLVRTKLGKKELYVVRCTSGRIKEYLFKAFRKLMTYNLQLKRTT